MALPNPTYEKMHTTPIYVYALDLLSTDSFIRYERQTHIINKDVEMFNLYEPRCNMWFSFCVNLIQDIVRIDKIRGLKAENPVIIATWYLTTENARRVWSALRKERRGTIRWLNDNEFGYDNMGDGNGRTKNTFS